MAENFIAEDSKRMSGRKRALEVPVCRLHIHTTLFIPSSGEFVLYPDAVGMQHGCFAGSEAGIRYPRLVDKNGISCCGRTLTYHKRSE
jgi:hypothetical protein